MILRESSDLMQKRTSLIMPPMDSSLKPGGRLLRVGTSLSLSDSS